jgi:hypothetical protein
MARLGAPERNSDLHGHLERVRFPVRATYLETGPVSRPAHQSLIILQHHRIDETARTESSRLSEPTVALSASVRRHRSWLNQICFIVGPTDARLGKDRSHRPRLLTGLRILESLRAAAVRCSARVGVTGHGYSGRLRDGHLNQ